MGIGAISITSPGSVTAPSSLTPTVSSALTTVFKPYALSDAILLPSLKAVLFCNGVDFQYHVLDSAQYLNGPLAPGAAPDAASTATRATVTLTFSGASAAAARPADGDVIRLGKPGTLLNGAITFKTTLDAASSVDQVLIGADIDACIANITQFLNNTGIHGTDFYSARMANYGYTEPAWGTENDIEVSASTAFAAGSATVTFRALTYGPVGNSYLAVEVTDSGAVMTGLTNYFSGGAAGTQAVAGSAPSNGTYKHAIARYRSSDRAQTAISPVDSTQNGGNVDMTVGTFGTAPTRDGITHTRVFRSTVGGGSQFYRAVDTTGTSVTDSVPDTTLVGDFAILYDPRFKRPYTAGYPTRRRFGTVHRGAAFLTGILPHGSYALGTVAVTKDSKTATFSSAGRYKNDVIGMVLTIENDGISYLVVDFDESTRAATLNRSYEGTTNGTANYTLVDDRNPFAIDYSVANLYNDWPPAQNLEGVWSPDATGTTGILSAWDTLLVWTRTGVTRVEGSPDTGFRIVPVAEGCGAYTNQSIVNVEGTLYWLGPDGIYEWSGGGIPTSLSNPPAVADGVGRGIADTLTAINPDQVDQVVANYNRTENIVRWFVPMDDSPWNNKVIVLDLQTGAFSLDTCPPVTAVASVVGGDGDFYTVVGTAFGEVFQLDLGLSDGAYGFDPVGTYSSYAAASKTVTVTGTTLPTSGDGLKGVPVLKVDADGDVETAYISTNASTTFTTTYPFTTAPTTGDKFIFGGIEWRLRTSRCDYGLPESRKRLSSVHASFSPQTVAGQVWCFGAKDADTATVFTLRSSAAADVATLSSLVEGGKKYVLHKGAGKRATFGFLALCPGFDVELLSWKAEIDARQEVGA